MTILSTLVRLLGEDEVGSDALPALVPAIIAAGSLVAYADGACDPRELEEIDTEALQYIADDPEAASHIHHVFEQHAANFDRDADYGRDRACAVLADFAPGAPQEQRDLVMRAALDVGKAGHGGTLTPTEREAALEIARVLKLEPGSYGL